MLCPFSPYTVSTIFLIYLEPLHRALPQRGNKSSWLAVSELNNQTLKFPTEPVPAHPHAPKPQPEFVEAHISAVEVPVTYTAVLSMIPPLHASKQYDVILHVGVGKPGGLEVERLAHKMGYNQTDADGKLCEGTKGKRGFGQGYEEFGDEIRTGVDVDAVVKHLHSKGLKVSVGSSHTMYTNI